MPRSCSSCTSPSDEVFTFEVGVTGGRPPWLDADEVFTSSLFRQDGRPKDCRLLVERKYNNQK